MKSKADELKEKLRQREEEFKKQQQQLKARIQLQTARERKVRDKVETHVKVVAGALAFELAEQDEGFRKRMQDYIQGHLEDRPADWPYFEDFPRRKNGELLFRLKEPKGWHQVVAARKNQRQEEKRK